MSGTVLTNKGLALITKLVAASTELQISRVAVGTGRVPSGVDPQTMVDLNEYKMDAQIESYGVSPDQSDVAYIAAQVSSIGVSAGFAVTEAGVFATDPDVGEILYAYLDLTEDPQYIYAETDAISKFAEITFNVLIGSVTKVTAYVSPGALTKKVDFNAFKESVETPEFDDSGTVEGISSFPSFLETMKSKMNFFQFFRNLKAGLQFVLHAGQIVNNCVTDNAGLPLSAAQGKVLKDLYTQLYSDKADKSEFTWKTLGTVSNNEVLNISNITKTANEICIVVYFLIDKNERDYFYIIPVAGLGDGGSVITIGGYYAAAGDYGVVQVNASTSGIGLVTVYHGGQDVRSKASLKVRYR